MITVDIGPALLALVKILWVKIFEEARFIKNAEATVMNLERKRDELVNRANGVIREIHRTSLDGKIPTFETVEWVEQVDQIKEKVIQVSKHMTDLFKHSKACSRRRFSRRSLRLTSEIENLIQRCPFQGGLTVDQLPVVGHILPAMTLVGDTTAKTTLEELWKMITVKNIDSIGVHGMGGVGKTTIAKHINNKLVESEIFDSIIWVSVSKPVSLASLQADIALSVELNMPEGLNETIRAALLFKELKKRKKFVLILDDMWEAFPLEHIGIPQPNSENCCKILLTTRSAKVCREMEMSIEIKVDLLSEEEAWELFKEKIGGDDFLSLDIEPVAKSVAKKCGRLPLAINTVGRALRQIKDVRIWRNKLAEMENLRNMDEVLMPLRFSYDRLKKKILKDCFLCCALFPQHHRIPVDHLSECFSGMGLIEEAEDRQAEVDKAYALLRELEDAELLEGLVGAQGEEYVQMHDLIRDMAFDIMSEQWLDEREWVSLMQNKIEVLSSRPRSPSLSILLLRENPLCKFEEDSVFSGMQKLKVLDLAQTMLESLPGSICELVSLRVLFLGSCPRLRTVPSLETLQELRVLDLSHTPIETLPSGLENLVKLRRLDLSHTENLKLFPKGLLARLPLLEDLSTYQSSWLWLVEGEEIEDGAVVDEIIGTEKLSNLSISFFDFSTFTRYVVSRHWRRLRRFNLMVGWTSVQRNPKSLNSIEIISEELLSQGSSFHLPCSALKLHIENCHDLLSLSETPSFLELSLLRECSLYTCWGIECLVTENGNPFSSLETLKLWGLPNLSSLCQQNIQNTAFTGLKVLEMNSCDKLECLFTVPLLWHFEKLEQLRVINCASITEIITGEEAYVGFPRLKKFDLLHLPELKRIYSGKLVYDSSLAIVVENCPKMKKSEHW